MKEEIKQKAAGNTKKKTEKKKKTQSNCNYYRIDYFMHTWNDRICIIQTWKDGTYKSDKYKK